MSDTTKQAPSPADVASLARPRPAAEAKPVEPVGPVTPAREVTGAQSLVLSLEAIGCDTVFGIPGGAILPAYDPMLDSKKVRHILVRHEQGAGHAAEGYAVGDRQGRASAWRPRAPARRTS